MSRSFRAAAIALAGLVAACGMLFTTTPASASTFYSDGFESTYNQPWERWDTLASGDGTAGFDINRGVALWGQNNGWLVTGTGWAALRTPLDLSLAADRSNCTAMVFAKALGSGAQVALQLWDPQGWHLIAETSSWMAAGADYYGIRMERLNLSNYNRPIYVQVIYGNSNAPRQFVRVDAMSLGC